MGSKPTINEAELLRFKDVLKSPSSWIQRLSVGKWLHPKLSRRYPEKPGITYVLRNLTMKQYVRADEFAFVPRDVHGPVIKNFGFGQIIASKISWSSDGSMTMKYAQKHGFSRGAWAGHRFDIVLIDSFDLNGWENISKAVREELEGLYEEVFCD